MEIQIRLPVTTSLTSSISIWIQLSICVGNESKEKFSESNEKFVVNRDSEPWQFKGSHRVKLIIIYVYNLTHFNNNKFNLFHQRLNRKTYTFRRKISAKQFRQSVS